MSKKYVKVHIQFVQDSAEKILEMAKDFCHSENLSVEDVDTAISNLAEVRMPRLPYPTYISKNNSVGDIVQVPYGAAFYPVGVVLDILDEEDVDLQSGIKYKPVRKTLVSVDDYVC